MRKNDPEMFTILLFLSVIPYIFSENCTGILLAKNVCIPKNYDKSDPPAKNDVFIKMRNIQLIDVNEKSEKLTLSMLLFISWYDDRIILWKNQRKPIKLGINFFICFIKAISRMFTPMRGVNFKISMGSSNRIQL